MTNLSVMNFGIMTHGASRLHCRLLKKFWDLCRVSFQSKYIWIITHYEVNLAKGVLSALPINVSICFCF